MHTDESVEQVRAILVANRTDIEDLIIEKRKKKQLIACGWDVRGLDLAPCAETLRT